ncbi:MAG TPA: hypothetical protein DEQ34_04345 [Balneolaceae bacterium]|nr:hypothetical protein [Balneolaceae bacterium]|tara:strand:+ start:89737 stop:90402 length:666 start_codon:yes stop_codon:yes gene_type:complete
MKIIKATGVVLGVIIIGIVKLTLSIDGMVKSGIEKNGSEMLNTEVSVADVDLSLLDGSGSIEGFEVNNPEKYNSENAIRIKKATIRVDLASLFSDQVIIKDLRIYAPELTFEQEGMTANLKELNDQLDTSGDEDSDKMLVIEHLIVDKGKVTVSTDIDRERMASAEIDRFELNNIGKEGNNTIQQSIKQVIEPMLQEAITKAATSGVLDQLKNKAKEIING